MSNELWVASCVFLILGAVCAAAGAALRYYSRRNERYRDHAEARVVDIVTEPRTGSASLSEFRHRQAAVFEFYADGKLIKIKDSSNTYPSPYQMNQKVIICYNAEKPQEYRILKNDKWKYMEVACNVMSILGILAGCILYLLYISGVQI